MDSQHTHEPQPSGEAVSAAISELAGRRIDTVEQLVHSAAELSLEPSEIFLTSKTIAAIEALELQSGKAA